MNLDLWCVLIKIHIKLIWYYFLLNVKKAKNSINVLITSSGAMGGMSLIQSLRKNFEKRKIKVICTDINYQPIIRHFADGFYQLPKGNSKNYIQALISVCQAENMWVFESENGEVFYELLLMIFFVYGAVTVQAGEPMAV